MTIDYIFQAKSYWGGTVKVSANQIQSTLQKYILADGMHIIYDMDKSHHSYIVDAATGKEYIDLFSFFATQPIAHNHPKIIDPEFREKIARVALHRPTLVRHLCR
jgi:L-lysine 6-transaminase